MSILSEKVVPYQSCTKSIFLIIGIVFIFWISLFSIFLILNGAWPVTIFLGIEYVTILYLMRVYFRGKNIKDEINVSGKEISIKKFKDNHLLHSSSFSTYWSKIFFKKFKNKSTLLIRQSNKQTEIAPFLHTDLKESLYLKINSHISKIN